MKTTITTLCLVITGLIFINMKSRAQDLIQNGSFTLGNSGFSTNYTYVVSGNSTTPGTFGIRSNSQDFNSGAYTAFGDHTTGSGQMMLIDGVPTSTVWSESLSVNNNTTYTFSVWAAPSDAQNPAILQFLINGSQIGSTLTLNGSPGVWVNFNAMWQSLNNNTANLSIVDVNPSGQTFGDDFALDDISFVKIVPEPSSAVMVGAGIFLLTVLTRRIHLVGMLKSKK